VETIGRTLIVSCSEDNDAGFIANQALGNPHLPSLGPSLAASLDDHLGVNNLDDEVVAVGSRAQLIDLGEGWLPASARVCRHCSRCSFFLLSLYFSWLANPKR
jgi:hypothetical protein